MHTSFVKPIQQHSYCVAMYLFCLNKVLGGTVQQETVKFTVEGCPVKGLKVLKKTYKGALGPFKVHSSLTLPH
jgi:hypothetical protein